MEITPIGPRVLIKQLETKEKTDSGIYLPDSAKDKKKKEGLVVEVGTGEDGKSLPLSKGDHILYGGYSNEEFTIDDQEYVIVNYEDVLAKVN